MIFFEDNNAVILQVFLKADHTSQPTRIQPVGKTRSVTGLAVSPNGAWLVATAGHKVYIAKTSSLLMGFTEYITPERLTCCFILSKNALLPETTRALFTYVIA
jgi:NET1-associated nuclear protein 1 (U3 small nucleolar RNA-associated protein 17)